MTRVAVAGEPDALRNMKERVKAVLHWLQQDAPLTEKQLCYCDENCIERCLRARGNNVPKAAKLLRSILTWRDGFDVGYLIADEFSAELAAGPAYVAGQDAEGRPVLVIRKKNNYFASWSQKQYLRYLIFTMEVAVASMRPQVEQWILILDIGYTKINSPTLSIILSTLKILSENYPERLARAFIVDAPRVLYYIWKGVCSFVAPATRGKLTFAFSKDYATDTSFKHGVLNACSSEAQRVGGSYREDCRVSTLSFVPKWMQESASFELQLRDQSESCKTCKNVLVANTHVRSNSSCSASSSAANSPALREREYSSFRAERTRWVNVDKHVRSFRFADRVVSKYVTAKNFDQPKSACHLNDNKLDAFRPYINFYRAPYNENSYRAMMKAPLGGLKSIIYPMGKSKSSFS